MADDDQNKNVKENPDDVVEVVEQIPGFKGKILGILYFAKTLYKEKKLLVLIGAGVLLLLIITILVYFLYLRPKLHSAQSQEEMQYTSSYYPLADIKLRLKKGDSSRVGLLVIGLTIKLPQGAKLEDYKNMEPDILDALQMYLLSLTPEDFSSSQTTLFSSPVGLERLRYHLVLRVNQVIAPLKIDTLLYRKLMVQ